MMMAPYAYVAGLEGKTREEALKEIKELRKEIKRLRAAIEEEVHSAEWRHSPSPDVRISVYYDYIDVMMELFVDNYGYPWYNYCVKCKSLISAVY